MQDSDKQFPGEKDGEWWYGRREYRILRILRGAAYSGPPCFQLITQLLVTFQRRSMLLVCTPVFGATKCSE